MPAPAPSSNANGQSINVHGVIKAADLGVDGLKAAYKMGNVPMSIETKVLVKLGGVALKVVDVQMSYKEAIAAGMTPNQWIR